MSESGPVRVERHLDGAVLQFVLDRPKANIIDAAMTQALRDAVQAAGEVQGLRAIVIEGAGDHFSFGASVEEHLPDKVADMLGGFHSFFKELMALRVPLLSAVRGQCLGGGLEVAAFCNRVFASPTAKLGQPEIVLGVIAPVGSLVLPRRCGQAAADDLLLTGRVIDAEAALACGLVDEIVDDPTAAALAYAEKAFLGKSAASLGVAVEAARTEYEEAFLDHIDEVEALYLERLMSFEDAEEGIRAFLEKRKPTWTHA